jgi:hypothetical protein
VKRRRHRRVRALVRALFLPAVKAERDVQREHERTLRMMQMHYAIDVLVEARRKLAMFGDVTAFSSPGTPAQSLAAARAIAARFGIPFT